MTMRTNIHDSRLHVVDFAEMVLHLLFHVHHVLQTHVLLDLQLDDGVRCGPAFLAITFATFTASANSGSMAFPHTSRMEASVFSSTDS